MENGKQSAFPSSLEDSNGLTKREYLAAMAMQGILSSDNINMKNMPYEEKAKFSVVMADELLKALIKL